jgi:dihydroflavonol-4-reductase
MRVTQERGEGTRSEDRPVLVTGGSGYVAGHVIGQLLNRGFEVRTTVRSAARAGYVRELLDEGGVVGVDRLEFAVADLGSSTGWRDATDGVGEVLHVASPLPGGTRGHQESIVPVARDGVVRVLDAAAASGVRRVVMTSSYAAVGYSDKPGDAYDEDDWTDPSDDVSDYAKAKTLAERAAWEHAKTLDGAVELAVVIPTGIFGPVLGDELSASVEVIRAMLNGLPVLPPMYFGAVDVRDVADLHIRAMQSPGMAGHRVLASAGTTSFLELGSILREVLGEAGRRIPTTELTGDQLRAAARDSPDLKDPLRLLGQRPTISNAKAREKLGWRPRPIQESIVDTAESLIRRGLVDPLREGGSA